MKYAITRAVNGISLNGRECLLTLSGEVMTFDTETSARSFANRICTGHNGTDVDMAEYGIDICQMEDSLCQNDIRLWKEMCSGRPRVSGRHGDMGRPASGCGI
jgi:hypothetical protein